MQKNIRLPQVELEMESVTVVTVAVAVGDLVDAERPIIEVETQKATIEVPASESGYVRKLFVKSGDTIGKDALLCVLTDAPDEAFEEPTAGASVSGDGRAPGVEKARNLTESAGAGSATIGAVALGEIVHDGKIVPAAPAARRVARELNVDLRYVRGSGPNGRVKVEDVQSVAAAAGSRGTRPSQPAAAAPERPGEWTMLSPTRLALVAQMQKSLAEIPQIHIARQVDVTPLTRKVEGVTFTHRLIVAAAAALAKHPPLRTSIRGDKVRVEPVSVAVAMDTPGGLTAPALRNADRLTLSQVSAAVEDFRKRGATKTLRREELADAPFAITNLGMFGVDLFQPFVFYGQTAVLAVARATDAPGGRKVAWFILAADHRVVDGAESARFLETLQQEILHSREPARS